jgi:hypothetical protein
MRSCPTGTNKGSSVSDEGGLPHWQGRFLMRKGWNRREKPDSQWRVWEHDVLRRNYTNVYGHWKYFFCPFFSRHDHELNTVTQPTRFKPWSQYVPLCFQPCSTRLCDPFLLITNVATFPLGLKVCLIWGICSYEAPSRIDTRYSVTQNKIILPSFSCALHLVVSFSAI